MVILLGTLISIKSEIAGFIYNWHISKDFNTYSLAKQLWQFNDNSSKKQQWGFINWNNMCNSHPLCCFITWSWNCCSIIERRSPSPAAIQSTLANLITQIFQISKLTPFKLKLPYPKQLNFNQFKSKLFNLGLFLKYLDLNIQ